MYAEVPEVGTLAVPYHPRINPRDAYVAGDEGGERHYYDPVSKELLQAGWRYVCDGVDAWYGHRTIRGGQWEAPLLKPKKKKKGGDAGASSTSTSSSGSQRSSFKGK